MSRRDAVINYIKERGDIELGLILEAHGVKILEGVQRESRHLAEKIAYRMIMDGDICD